MDKIEKLLKCVSYIQGIDRQEHVRIREAQRRFLLETKNTDKDYCMCYSIILNKFVHITEKEHGSYEDDLVYFMCHEKTRHWGYFSQYIETALGKEVLACIENLELNNTFMGVAERDEAFLSQLWVFLKGIEKETEPQSDEENHLKDMVEAGKWEHAMHLSISYGLKKERAVELLIKGMKTVRLEGVIGGYYVGELIYRINQIYQEYKI